MSKYDYNEIFEDGIGRDRRVGKVMSKTGYIFFLIVMALALTCIIHSFTI